jgi:hypothetical protein
MFHHKDPFLHQKFSPVLKCELVHCLDVTPTCAAISLVIEILHSVYPSSISLSFPYTLFSQHEYIAAFSTFISVFVEGWSSRGSYYVLYSFRKLFVFCQQYIIPVNFLLVNFSNYFH